MAYGKAILLVIAVSAATIGVKAVFLHRKDSPARLSKRDDRVTQPEVISATESLTVRVFFGNSRLDPESSGERVFAVERSIQRTRAVARGALEELLKGPSEQERARDYFTSINTGVKIQRLVIENGTAMVDFDEQLEFQVGGACRVSAIRAQITETLKQFASVDEVLISINGRTQDILQP